MTTLQELEEYNRLATQSPSIDNTAAKAKAAKEAADRQAFNDTMFGNKKRQDWGKKMELWEKHKALIDQDPRNFNFWRVTFPTSIWAKDPVTGNDRQPGDIDLAEFRLEDISIQAYLDIHGEGAPSGLPAGTDVTGIVDAEKAKAIRERAGLEWDIQEVRVRKLRSDREAWLIQALDPWRWNNGKVDHELIDRIEKSTMPTRASAGTAAIFGQAKPTGGALGEGIDDLLARATQFDNGAGSDRSLAYALAVMFRNNPSFQSRLFMLGQSLQDENIQALYAYQALYGAFARDRRQFDRLAPIHVPEWIRYGTQEQLERNLQAELERNQVA
jgi:hypothetical protein